MTTPTPKDKPPFDPPVFCSGIERDCRHGQLARSCNICELERELASALERAKSAGEDAFKLRVDLAAAQKELERVRDKCNEHYMALAAAQSDLASMKADRDAIYNSMRERALAAEARAEQNAKDAERLDWMEANFREGTVRYLHRAFEKWSVNYHKGTTFRAAIDAAREGK